MNTVRAVMILGAHGQVGRALQHSAPSDWKLLPFGSGEADIRDERRLRLLIDELRPHTIINCAAITHVDNAEAQPELAAAINAHAPGLLATIARDAGSRFVHISTDYVFDGSSGRPYTIDSSTSPISVYGRTKVEGEESVLRANPDAVVLRTAWVHSAGSRNFVRLVCEQLTQGKTMRVVDDQTSTPTYALHLATALWRLAERPEVRGIHHFTDGGLASRYDVAVATARVLEARGVMPETAAIIGVPSSEFPSPAARPIYSVLDKHATWTALGYVPPHWSVGVERTANEVLDA